MTYKERMRIAMNEDAAWLGRILAAPEAANLLAALEAYYAAERTYMFMTLPDKYEPSWRAIDNLINRYSMVSHSGSSWNWVVRNAVWLAGDAHR